MDPSSYPSYSFTNRRPRYCPHFCWQEAVSKGSHDISKYRNKLLAGLFYTFVDRGLNIHSRAFFGQPYLYSISQRSYTILDLLLGHGIDCTTSDYKLQTILQIAAKYGDIINLRILKSYSLRRLDIDQKTTDGLTAINIAEARTDVGRAWIVALGELLESIQNKDDLSTSAAQLEEADEDEDEDNVFEDAREYQKKS